ncbi:MAG: hypothetical protein JWM87_3728 [Candidatus Eremiobacteraeota bacterium]|nr:hypothetical protein [Candidatus Eremiobacteraeota bacterium]
MPTSLKRSSLLKGAGFAVLGLAATGTPAFAQAGTTKMSQVQDTAALRTMTLGSLKPEQLREITVARRLPDTTPIQKMLTPEAAKGLTPAAMKLTKGDLNALGTGELTPTTKQLTVADITSVQTAFTRPNGPAFLGGGGGMLAGKSRFSVSCCCCSPCCCAAAGGSAPLYR